jgi:glutaminyl-tRNA synthetase
MKKGEFPDGSRTLRAKIDMSSPNLNLRDPVMYRILHLEHHRTGDQWCIYPMYDYAHGQSDSIEKVTHSICTLEFENNRHLYNWFIEQLGIFPSQQFEFDRLNLTYTLLSKRKLLTLVQEGHVRGWDDPRMPTLSGMRRRGYTPEAIRAFCANTSVSKTNNTVQLSALEHFVREKLNKRAPRVMVVLRPLRVVIIPMISSSKWRRSTIPKTRGWALAPYRSRKFFTSSKTIFAKIHASGSSGWRPAARSGCAMAT